jgi:uncharacterized membrane protein YbhN (UPF0104 family)
MTPDAPKRNRHLVRGAIGLLVSVLSLAAVATWASHQDTPRFPHTPGRIALLAVAALVYALAMLTRGRRWHRVLSHAGVRHQTADAYALVPVGYMGNTVLPARGGELLRILLLAERSDARRLKVLGTILSERTLDAATLIVLLAGLTLAGVAGNPAGTAPVVGGFAALLLGLAGLWVYLTLRRRGHFQRVADLLRPVVGAARPLVGKPGIALGAMTVVIWALDSAVFWLVGVSLRLDIGYFDACLVLVLTAFFSLIPAAPGYVGTFDAAVIFALKALDVTGGQAVSFVLLVRFVLFVPITVIGLGLLVSRYGGLRQLRRRDAPEPMAGPA